MDKTDRLRDYGLAFLLYEQGLGVCGYELIRELFIFVKLILNSYLFDKLYITQFKAIDKEFASRQQAEVDGTMLYEYILNEQLIEKLNKDIEL